MKHLIRARGFGGWFDRRGRSFLGPGRKHRVRQRFAGIGTKEIIGFPLFEKPRQSKPPPFAIDRIATAELGQISTRICGRIRLRCLRLDRKQKYRGSSARTNRLLLWANQWKRSAVPFFRKIRRYRAGRLKQPRKRGGELGIENQADRAPGLLRESGGKGGSSASGFHYPRRSQGKADASASGWRRASGSGDHGLGLPASSRVTKPSADSATFRATRGLSFSMLWLKMKLSLFDRVPGFPFRKDHFHPGFPQQFLGGQRGRGWGQGSHAMPV